MPKDTEVLFTPIDPYLYMKLIAKTGDKIDS